MTTQITDLGVSAGRSSLSALRPPPHRTTHEESLPFTIRIVDSEKSLKKALRIRQSAYARHLPTFAETMHSAESIDIADGVVILLAESKFDGSPMGTMRIQTNRFQPLCLEQSVDLPSWLASRPLAEATRLGIATEKVGPIVKTALFKAFYLYCVQQDIEWMVITGRAPIDRQYERLLFNEVYPGMGFIPLKHVGGLPHRIMSFDVLTAKARWAQAGHPLFKFVFETSHPDIDLSASPAIIIQ